MKIFKSRLIRLGILSNLNLKGLVPSAEMSAFFKAINTTNGFFLVRRTAKMLGSDVYMYAFWKLTRVFSKLVLRVS